MINRLLIGYSILLSVFLFISCDNEHSSTDDIKVLYLTISPHKGLHEDWGGVSDRDAYVFTVEGSKIKRTVESISGFDAIYEEGYKYVIKVQAEAEVDAKGEFWPDAYGYKYKLIEVISKEKQEYEELYFTVASSKIPFRNWLGTTDIPAYFLTTSEGVEEIIISISGFDEIYENGYQYVIKVRAEHNGNMEPAYWPNPYGGYTYELIEIISKEMKNY